jgi:hypothetical protein
MYRGTGARLKMRAFPYNSMFPGVGQRVVNDPPTLRQTP